MSRFHARHKGPWRIAVGLGAVTLFFAVVTPVANADTGPNPASTKANVVSGSTPPSVDCSWAMPDMNRAYNGTNIAYYDGTTGNSDDDPLTNPTPTSPCAIPVDGSGTPTGFPTQANGARHQVQVRPNALNQPTPRRIELWSAVSAPGGLSSINSVFWKVYHPDGTFKAQIHAENLVNGVPQNYEHGAYAAPSSALSAAFPRSGDCYGPGGSTPNAGPMFKGASTGATATNHGNNELSAGAADAANNNSLIAACNQQQRAFFYAGFDLHKEQPCGEYIVEAHAVVNGAEATVLKYSVDVQCFYDLETDFTSVDWQTLIPGSPKTLAGDTLFNPGDGRPTVRNGGNTGMEIGIQFAPLVQSDANGVALPGGKLITWFDGLFGRDPNHLQPIAKVDSGIHPQVLGAPSYFDSSPANGGQPYYQVLCSDEVGKLDLSVHPAPDLPAGNYVGSMAVVAQRMGGDGKGNGQTWRPDTLQFPRVDNPTSNNNLISSKLCWQDQVQITPAF